MPKISEFPEAEALTGDEAVPVARTVGGVAETVRVPLSLLLALLEGASFADLVGAPGDNPALAAALAARAPLDSPALAGTPTAPTAAGGTSTPQLATCAFVMGAIAALVGAAPENLNSFQEFADALGEDPNFATTILDQLAAKADAAATTAALAQKASTADLALKAALAGPQTLTATRVTKRVVAAGATSGAMAPSSDAADTFDAAGLTGAIALGAPGGTPTAEQQLILRLRDNGTSRAITWTTSAGGYRAAKNVTLPAATTAGKWLRVCCIWNAADGFWDVVAVVEQA